MSKFKQIEEDIPITIKYKQALKQKGAYLHFACCDCGLVHDIVMMPLKTRIKMWFWRDNKATANVRRGNKYKTKEKE